MSKIQRIKERVTTKIYMAVEDKEVKRNRNGSGICQSQLGGID